MHNLILAAIKNIYTVIYRIISVVSRTGLARSTAAAADALGCRFMEIGMLDVPE